jgi:hypothetical protein
LTGVEAALLITARPTIRGTPQDRYFRTAAVTSREIVMLGKINSE